MKNIKVAAKGGIPLLERRAGLHGGRTTTKVWERVKGELNLKSRMRGCVGKIGGAEKRNTQGNAPRTSEIRFAEIKDNEKLFTARDADTNKKATGGGGVDRRVAFKKSVRKGGENFNRG